MDPVYLAATGAIGKCLDQIDKEGPNVANVLKLADVAMSANALGVRTGHLFAVVTETGLTMLGHALRDEFLANLSKVDVTDLIGKCLNRLPPTDEELRAAEAAERQHGQQKFNGMNGNPGL